MNPPGQSGTAIVSRQRMKIFLAQINPTVGALEANCELILDG